MAHVFSDIKLIKERLNEIAALADTHGSRKTRQAEKRHQTDWQKVRALVEELTESVQHVEEKVGIPATNQNINARNAACEPLPPAADHRRNEGQLPDRSSPTAPVPTTSDRPPNESQLSDQSAPVEPVPATSDNLPIEAQHSGRTEIVIAYREEHNVVVLMPNKHQYRDILFLISQAEKLGARATGAFKYVLPKEVVTELPPISRNFTAVSKFKSHGGPKNICQVLRSVQRGRLDIGDGDFRATPRDEFAEILERRLTDAQAMSKMQYCTDMDARTTSDRQQLGLPAESPIWPLYHNQLDRTRKVVPGLHFPYGYVSGVHGSLFCSHKEDQDIPSLNLLHNGEKLWYVVAPKDARRIEKIVEHRDCAQKVRHESLWFSRSDLNEMNVSFVTIVQQKNEVVAVFGGAYHQGGTLGHSHAEAVNFAPPGWSVNSDPECNPTKCPGTLIPNTYLEFRSPDEPQLDAGDEGLPKPHHSTRSASLRLNAPSTANLRKRGGSPSPAHKPSDKKIRTSTDIDALISQMAESICSRDAIMQFFSIVKGRRLLEPTALRMGPIQDLSVVLRKSLKSIKDSSQKANFNDFVVRLAQIRLARYATDVRQGQKGLSTRIRIQKGTLRKVLQDLNMREGQYHYHRERGEKWQTFTEKYPGILAFILFQPQSIGVSLKEWLELGNSNFPSLCRHLDAEYVSALCSAGKKFEDSLNLTAEEVEFIGETQCLDQVPQKDLLSCLQSVETTEEIIYDGTAYPNWPRPEYWPDAWDWPVDPIIVPSNQTQCHECDKDHCNCASQLPDIQPRIRIYENKGRGLQAVAKEAGRLAYRKGVRIGWFAGVLVPFKTTPRADKQRKNWCYELRRDDLTLQPSVGLLDCSQIRSIFALMNHDCDPSVHLEGKRVQGQYRVGVHAARNIYDGEELTQDYGRGFWEGPCPCSTCHSRDTAQSK